MKRNLKLKALSLAAMLLLIGLPRPGLAQEAGELEKLKATVKAMDQTTQIMKSKIAELEQQRAATPGIITVRAGAARTGLSTS